MKVKNYFPYHVSNNLILALSFDEILDEEKLEIYSFLGQLKGKCSIICLSSYGDIVLSIINNLSEKIELNQSFICYSNSLFIQFLIESKDTNNDFSFVIQGLIKPEIDKAKFYYFQFGIPVEAIWEAEELNKLQNEIKERNYFNKQNLYLQLTSTLKGLKKVKTGFAIKCRSDEYYSDFRTFCKTLQDNPEKVITGDLFVRKYNFAPYHLSDHIIGCETKNFIKSFEYAQKICKENNELSKYYAEQIIMKCFLSIIIPIEFKSLEETHNKCKEYILNNALIVGLKYMGNDIRCCANCFKKVYNSVDDVGHKDLISSIDEIFI